MEQQQRWMARPRAVRQGRARGGGEYIRRHIYERVPREKCLRETGKGPIKTGWTETDKRQPGKPNVRARWVAREKEYKTHVRPYLRASTPPLEALKVALSKIATDNREGKVVALVDVRRAYFYVLREGDDQAGDEHMCELLRYSLYGTRDAVQNWEEELASTLSKLKLTIGVACSCVWQGHIRGEHVWQPCTEMASPSVENG